MHELSIALSIVEGVTEEAEARGLSNISAVHLRMGALSGVVKEALLFSYAAACQDTPLAGTRLCIEETSVVIFCANCNCERAPRSAQLLSCEVCGSPPAAIVRGTELEVSALEVCDEQSAAAG